MRLCTCFLFKFYWAPVRVGFPLGVLSALYTYHVSAFVLLLFNMDSKLID